LIGQNMFLLAFNSFVCFSLQNCLQLNKADIIIIAINIHQCTRSSYTK